MSVNFANVKSITIPQGVVQKILNSDGVVLWEKSPKFLWKKYNTATIEVAPFTESTEERTEHFDRYIYPAKSYTFDETTGLFTLAELKASPYLVANWSSTYKYFISIKQNSSDEFETSGNVMYEYVSKTSDGTATRQYTYILHTANGVETNSQGTYIEDVTAETEDAYPNNGMHTDGYWYVLQER